MLMSVPSLLRAWGGRIETTTMQTTETKASRKAVGVRVLLLEVLVLLLDDQGGGLGLADDVARDDLDRAELAERPGQAEHDAVDDRPLDARAA